MSLAEFPFLVLPRTLGAAPWRFEHPAALLLLLLLPLAVLTLWFGFSRGKRALVLLAGQTPHDTRPSNARAAVKVTLLIIALASLIVAIARPQADPVEETVTVRGRDIAFVIDVSRSMLSRDVVPSRLGRTKIWINDLVNTLKGDRIALVAFAGVPVVKCPLTLDQGFFRMELDELSPASVARGGTLIGDAIRKTISAVFEPNPGRYRDIILVTDGEDQGSFPAEAAKAAAELGVRIIAIGIGSELEDAPIPAENSSEYLVHEGSTVRSKMDGSTLAAIAQAASSVPESHGGGVFLNVGTGTMDLDSVYHDLIASAEQRETDSKASVTYRELFPPFLALSALCLAFEPIVSLRVRARKGIGSAAVNALSGAIVACALCFGPSARAQTQPPTAQSPQAEHSESDGALPGPAASAAAKTKAAEPQVSTPQALYNEGRQLFLSGKFLDAAERFRAADLNASDRSLSASTRFNLGLALLKHAMAASEASPQPAGPTAASQQADASPQALLGNLENAVRAFRSALAVNPDDAQAARNIEIARRLMQQLLDAQKQQQQSQDKQGQSDKKDGSKDQGKDQSQDSKQSEQGDSPKSQEAKERQDRAEQLKDLAKQQSDAAEASKKAQEAKDASEQEQKAQESKSKQQDVNEKTKEQQRQAGDEKNKPAESTSKSLEKAQQEQQEADKALDRKDMQAAKEHQERAAEHLDQAAKSEEQAAAEAQQQANEERQQKDQQKDQKQAKERAAQEKPKYDQTASQALDKERKQREARQQMLRALRGRPVHVEKDW